MLKQAREADWVDYATVTALKMAALRLAWKGFAKRDDDQMAAFRQFVAQEGESLLAGGVRCAARVSGERGRNALGLAGLAGSVSVRRHPK
jgi:4-alpha-glucanotransferase